MKVLQENIQKCKKELNSILNDIEKGKYDNNINDDIIEIKEDYNENDFLQPKKIYQPQIEKHEISLKKQKFEETEDFLIFQKFQKEEDEEVNIYFQKYIYFIYM